MPLKPPTSVRIACVSMWLAWTGTLQAQASATETALADPRLAAHREQLGATVAAARQAGLPDAWLADKMREGLAKRVPGHRIAGAVQMLYGHMQAANRVLAHLPRAASAPAEGRGPQHRVLLRAVVDALIAGAPEKEMGALVRAVGRPERAGAPGARAAGVRPNDGQGDRSNAAQRVREGAVTVAELGERGFEGTAAVRATMRAFERAGTPGWSQLVAEARGIRVGDAAGRSRALHQVSERVHPAGPPAAVSPGARGRMPGKAGDPPGLQSHKAPPGLRNRPGRPSGGRP